ncbi:MAG: diacylglycerol kinase [Candidatus Moranbacteria bacterium]|nr:diacylglycerol kinase [Candidatus Moranbacteria bacterium]MDZ4384945.1 diacylglycerol kinase [Candidatus Moranbacteria bacterium]
MQRIKNFGMSLRHAINGLGYSLRYEKNFQNEVIVAVLVIGAMIYYRVTPSEMIVLFLVIMGVLIMELLNTVMERIADILKPRVHPYVRVIKDLMAASVLVTALLAIIIGCIIFIPYVFA